MRRSYVAMLAIDQIRSLPFALPFQTFTLRERENETTVISKVCLARHKADALNEVRQQFQRTTPSSHLRGIGMGCRAQGG